MKAKIPVCLLWSLSLLVSPATHADVPHLNDPAIVVPDVVPVRAYAFDLNQVTLLDGPFKHAQELDRENLLKADLEYLYLSLIHI